MTTAIDRARADLDAGRHWKARDRLTGLLVERQDADVLNLLARVHFEMHDLPAAGALWFFTGRDDEARWRSIPSPVRSLGGCLIWALAMIVLGTWS